MRIEVSLPSQTGCSGHTDVFTLAPMSVLDMKEDTGVTITAASVPSTGTQIWKDTAKAMSHPEPEVIFHACNRAATRFTQGKTTCSNIFRESMDEILQSIKVFKGTPSWEKTVIEDFLGQTTRMAIQDIWTYNNEVSPNFRTPPSSLTPTTLRFKDDVSPTFRTPPKSFVRKMFRTWEHEDKVIPTFRGHPTDRPSVPMCFRTRHKPEGNQPKKKKNVCAEGSGLLSNCRRSLLLRRCLSVP